MATILVVGGFNKGVTQAIAASRLGDEKVVFMGAVGNDQYGEAIVRNLTEANVDVSHMLHLEDSTEKLNSCCTEEYLKENHQLIENADIVLTQMEIPFKSVTYLIEEAYKCGKTIIVNPSPAPAETLSSELLDKINYLTPNEEELSVLCGFKCESVEECTRGAKALVDKGAKNVIVSVGKNGAVMVYPDGDASYPADWVIVRDTACAGDCFNGAIAAQLGWGKNINMAIEFAVNASTMCVQREGALQSIPKKGEVPMF